MLSVIEWVFLISGGFTFAYMLKLFICVFVQKNKDGTRQKRYDRDTGLHEQGQHGSGVRLLALDGGAGAALRKDAPGVQDDGL